MLSLLKDLNLRVETRTIKVCRLARLRTEFSNARSFSEVSSRMRDLSQSHQQLGLIKTNDQMITLHL